MCTDHNSTEWGASSNIFFLLLVYFLFYWTRMRFIESSGLDWISRRLARLLVFIGSFYFPPLTEWFPVDPMNWLRVQLDVIQRGTTRTAGHGTFFEPSRVDPLHPVPSRFFFFPFSKRSAFIAIRKCRSESQGVVPLLRSSQKGPINYATIERKKVQSEK